MCILGGGVSPPLNYFLFSLYMSNNKIYYNEPEYEYEDGDEDEENEEDEELEEQEDHSEYSPDDDDEEDEEDEEDEG